MALNLNTYGDLKKAIKSIELKQKGQQIVSQGKTFALDQLLGLIPGASNAKTTFDFIKAAISKPDTKKTNTWLDKLDIDDEMSKIVDDTVENGFMKAMAASVDQESDDKPLEPDFNMNAKMVNYLKQQYQGRTVAGIKENNEMNLKELIKQLVRKELEEDGGSTSGGVGAYSTPFAFSKKGQKSNAATKTAGEEGYKKVPAGMPSDSKIKDYKSIWPSAKKKTYKIYKETEEPYLDDEDKDDVYPTGASDWRTKKKKVAESDYDKASISSQASGYTAASGYTGVGGDNHENQYYKENMETKRNMPVVGKIYTYNDVVASGPDKGEKISFDEEFIKYDGDQLVFKIVKSNISDKLAKSYEKLGLKRKIGDTTRTGIGAFNIYYKEKNNMSESIQDIIKEELLSEGTYKQFKKEIKFRTKAEQLHKAMREVKRKLSEIDRIVEYTQRMKQELSEGDGVQYWGKTEKAVAQISEMVNHLNNKINNLKQ